MDGAHRGGRTVNGVVKGSKAVATGNRQRAQNGAGAAGRRGQTVQRARAVGKRKDQTIAKEVERSMKAGAALVQASIEHLDTAERR